MPAIIEFLGYNPLESSTSFPQRLIAMRRARGLTQKELAIELGVDPSTIRNWERSEHEPSQRKMSLLASQFII